MSTIPLSDLKRFHVIDNKGASTRLVDLLIHELDVDYPIVSHLAIHSPGRGEVIIPWRSVKSMDWSDRKIKIEGLQHSTTEVNAQTIYLERDVLDALILDLQNQRVTRANDLWFTKTNNGLRLTAADTGVKAILRRLMRGWYRDSDRGSHFDWKYVEFLRGNPQAVDSGAGYHRRIIHLPPGDIASLTTAVPYLHAAELLELLPEQLAADTMEVMSLERQVQVFEELEEDSAFKILNRMAPDLAADLLGCIEIQLAHQYINRL